MNITIFSSKLTHGTASQTALYFAQLFTKNGDNVHLITGFINSNIDLSSYKKTFKVSVLDSDLVRNFDTPYFVTTKPGYTIFSLNIPRISNKALEKILRETDIIMIHWTAEFLSIENIGFLSNIGKPVFLIMHDYFYMTGGCHVTHFCNNWKYGCGSCPQLQNNPGDYPAKIIKSKLKNWNFNNIFIVALSKFSERILKQSYLFKDKNIIQIYNPVNTNIFKPNKLNIKNEEKVFTIFHLPSFKSLVKGDSETLMALKLLKETYPNYKIRILIAGAGSGELISNLGYDVINVGFITDKYKMAQLYNKASLTLVPSLEETFSYTAAESLACGTPVLSFRTGFMSDFQSWNEEILKTVDVGDVEGILHGIRDFYKKNQKNKLNIGKESSSFIKKNFAPKKIIDLYNEAFIKAKKKVKGKNIKFPKSVDPDLSVDLLKWLSLINNN